MGKLMRLLLLIQRMGKSLTIDEQFDSCMSCQLNELTIEWIANERMAGCGRGHKAGRRLWWEPGSVGEC